MQNKFMQNKKYKYYSITSTSFGTGTQNVRYLDFTSSAYFNLPGK